MGIVVLRGVSGAGKTTWVENFKKVIGPNGRPVLVFSADNFFVTPEGKYVFDVQKLPQAHAKCLRDFTGYVQRVVLKDANIIVDNTNTTIAEIAPYMALGQAYGHDVRILTILADYELCAQRNIHGVSKETIQRQYDKMIREQDLFPPWWRHEIHTGE